MKKIVLHNAYRELNTNNMMLKADGVVGFGEGLFKPFHKLRDEFLKHNIELCSFDAVDIKEDILAYIFLDLPSFTDPVYRYSVSKNAQKFLILLESPIVKPKNYKTTNHLSFNLVFTWCDDLVDNIKYFKFLIPQPFEQFRENIVPFEQKKLATMIISKKRSNAKGELYSTREKIINYFEDNALDSFDLYGAGWDQDVYAGLLKPLDKILKKIRIKPRLFQRSYKCYKGKVDSKIDTMGKYRFAFAIENFGNSNGYITEKIFDCFFAGAVPIYLGAPDITKYIPEECFIDMRKYESIKSLVDYLNDLSEAQHRKYINAAEVFLKSKQGMVYSSERFAVYVVNRMLIF